MPEDVKIMDEYSIKTRYHKMKRWFGPITNYLAMIRPFTLVAPIMVGLFGVLAPLSQITFPHITQAIYVGATLALLQASGQVINQYADVELDKMVKPYRVIASGLVTRDEALGFALILALAALFRGFITSTFFGLMTLAILFFAIFYSLPPLSPRKIHPVVNLAWVSFSRGFLPMFAVWSIYGSLENAYAYAIFAFLWCLSLQGAKDLGDVEGDRAFGIKTMASEYGIKGFMLWAGIITGIMYIYALFTMPFMLLLIPVSGIAFLGLRRQVDGMENNIGWISFYCGLGIIYVVLFLF